MEKYNIEIVTNGEFSSFDFGPNMPFMLADKIKRVVNEFYKEKHEFYKEKPEEERRALFEKKAEIAGRMNAKANTCCSELSSEYRRGKRTLAWALILAWSDGCNYGRNNSEELKIFDK